MNGRTADEGLSWLPAGIGERDEHVLPDAFLRPPNEAVIEFLAGSVFGQRVNPSAARLQNVDDARDHPKIIGPRHTPSRVRRLGLQSGEALLGLGATSDRTWVGSLRRP